MVRAKGNAVAMTLVVLLAVQSFSAAGASDSVVIVKTDSAKSTSAAVECYLKQMHGPISQYLKVMLDLVPLVESPESSDCETLKADHTEDLIVALGKIAPPASIAERHGELKESLNTVVAFVNAGGLSKVGFSRALQIAQQMHDCSDRFHAVLAKEIAAKDLPQASDPFLAQQIAPNGSGSQVPYSDASMVKDDSANHAQVFADGSKHFSTGSYGQSQTGGIRREISE